MSEYNCDDCDLDCSTVVKALCRKNLIDECKALQTKNKGLRLDIKLWKHRVDEAAKTVEAFEEL